MKRFILVLVFILLLAGCSSRSGEGSKASESESTPASQAETIPPEYSQNHGEGLSLTHLTDSAIIDELCQKLEGAGLSHVDLFRGFLLDYAKAMGEEAPLDGDWCRASESKLDAFACVERWETARNRSDLNCRLTALTLLQNNLKVQKPVEAYQGSYLFFDFDALETVPDYGYLKEAETTLISLFGDFDVSALNDDELAAAYGRHWQEQGIQLENTEAQLLCIIVHDPYEKLLFVGHTGICLTQGDSVLFVEKIAFGAPYQLTRADNYEALFTHLATRSEYFGEEKEAGPFLYLNGQYQGNLRDYRQSP